MAYLIEEDNKTPPSFRETLEFDDDDGMRELDEALENFLSQETALPKNQFKKYFIDEQIHEYHGKVYEDKNVRNVSPLSQVNAVGVRFVVVYSVDVGRFIYNWFTKEGTIQDVIDFVRIILYYSSDPDEISIDLYPINSDSVSKKPQKPYPPELELRRFQGEPRIVLQAVKTNKRPS